ncbi:hypothetical protein PDE_07285 [Penicillium oxalicum 114-2]|uniref:Sensitive to high expression protein 9, mitochondrial n=1 Tax=Penicillium oxalicum (strain 114-2 / CGMCC 5302) TaxID=933388 RepID=S7ZNU6_PENO1|nr:hypothetical protein PDE_07285 [Penicillium oxalicum 114-2]
MQSVPLLLRQSLRAHSQIIRAGARSKQSPQVRFRTTPPNVFADRPIARSFSICSQCHFHQLPRSLAPLPDEKDKISDELGRVNEHSAAGIVSDGVPDSNAAAGTPHKSSSEQDSTSSWQAQMKIENEASPEGTAAEQKKQSTPSWSTLSSSAGGLPSYLENRRSQLSKQFTTMMDTMQANVFVAGQRLNDLTGYSAIEVLKKDIETQEDRLREARAQVRRAKENYTSAINNRSTSQREVNELLQRKHAWSPTDLERFTLLYRNDHANELAEAETQEALSRAEREAEEAAASLNKSILSRYHEEQVWSDKIRRMSTWGTWGLMGVNVLLFLIFQIAVEPWRRSRLVKGFEDKVVEALEKEKSLNHIHSAVSLPAGSVTLPEVIDSTVEKSVAAIEAPKDEPAEAPLTPAISPVEPSLTAEPTVEPAAESTVEPTPEKSLYTRVAEIPWAPITLQYWRQVIDELFAERIVSLSQRDITVAALQSAAAGAALTSLLLALVRPR